MYWIVVIIVSLVIGFFLAGRLTKNKAARNWSPSAFNAWFIAAVAALVMAIVGFLAGWI